MKTRKLKLSNGSTGFFNDRNEWQCTGSQMGRRDNLPEDTQSIGKLRLQRLPMIDHGAYDRWGAYWGQGTPIYIAHGDLAEVNAQVFVRAASREAAKAAVRSRLPGVTFYR